MSDNRNSDFDYRNSNDPLRRDPPFDPDERSMNATSNATSNATWGWIAAAIFVVVILAVAFGIGHEPGQPGTNTASNDVAPPAATRMAPPATPMAPPTNAAPPAATPAPISPTPNSPAQRSQP